MKSIIYFIFFFLFFFFGSKAFTQNIRVDISEYIRLKARQNGTALIHQEGDSIKIYATYKKNKVASMYAINKEGEKSILVYNPPNTTESQKDGTIKTEPIKCIACITKEDGTTVIKCWEIKCSELPNPKALRTTGIKKEVL